MATVPPPNPKRPLPRPGTGEELPREVDEPIPTPRPPVQPYRPPVQPNPWRREPRAEE